MVQTVIVQTPETTIDAPEDHNQKMIAKAEGAATPPVDPETPPAGDRPAWLPEKFKTAEDMAKSYAELEALQSKSKTVEPPVPPVDPNAPVPPPDDTKVIDDALTKANLSLTEFTQEFDTKGELSEASYAKLLAAGYDKGLVDSYIAGQQARAQLHTADLKNTVGGEQAYAEMTTWAKANMTQAEIDAYNVSVASPNTETAKLALAGLKARYTAANGTEPTFVKAQSTAAVADQFNSNNEVKAAMKDPRYKTDSAYRNAVAQKIARSPNVL